ncbi:SDR family oxidoreductase [bacterium CPR1]|nr:SDR family oxidoreductase [bacterium CPR1]
MKILVTGASGYIGGRLVRVLLERGHQVRVLVRDADQVQGRRWADQVEVYVGDLTRLETLTSLCQGVDVAYYLVHSMVDGADFARRDRQAAENFAAVAGGLSHVIYLGGLLPRSARVSRHLGSRAEVGSLLRERLPTTEFRAGPIIGSGSASFEMVRYLTERLPVMVAPYWILNPVQPIGIADVLSYLVAALDRGPSGVVDLGADVLSFKSMMEVYARVRGLRRLIFPLPVLAPGLAARWVGLVTPIPNRLAIPLVQGVVHPVVGDTEKARRLFPEIRPLSYREAVQKALRGVSEHQVETRWSGARTSFETSELTDREGVIREVRSVWVKAAPEQVFSSFTSIGGERGWLVWRWAWELRGFIDRILGGPGLRRGRRHPTELLPGEALDFWRVEEIEAPRRMLLRAEMKVPGRAWLEWESRPEEGGARLIQTAIFEPFGLAGALYWYALYPLHRLIFSDLARAVAKGAGARHGRPISLQPAPFASNEPESLPRA